MDARQNVYGALGLREGTIRNAGGVVTDDEIPSLAISQRLLGTEEIILIHHTDCGISPLSSTLRCPARRQSESGATGLQSRQPSGANRSITLPSGSCSWA